MRHRESSFPLLAVFLAAVYVWGVFAVAELAARPLLGPGRLVGLLATLTVLPAGSKNPQSDPPARPREGAPKGTHEAVDQPAEQVAALELDDVTRAPPDTKW